MKLSILKFILNLVLKYFPVEKIIADVLAIVISMLLKKIANKNITIYPQKASKILHSTADLLNASADAVADGIIEPQEKEKIEKAISSSISEAGFNSKLFQKLLKNIKEF